MRPQNGGQNFVQASSGNMGVVQNLTRGLQDYRFLKLRHELNKQAISHKTAEKAEADKDVATHKTILDLVGHRMKQDTNLDTAKSWNDTAEEKDENGEIRYPHIRASVAFGGLTTTDSGAVGIGKQAEVRTGLPVETLLSAAGLGEHFKVSDYDRNKQKEKSRTTSNVEEPASSATVARFKNGNVTAKPVKYEEVKAGRMKTQRAPKAMRETDNSIAPSDRTWTPEQKAALESERPTSRTSNLNTGMSEGKMSGNEHEDNVMNAWGNGHVTTGEALDLLPGNSQVRKRLSEYGSDMDTNETIQQDHTRAGLDDKKETKY